MQRVLPQLGAKVFMDKGTGTIIPLPIDSIKALLDPKGGGGR